MIVALAVHFALFFLPARIFDDDYGFSLSGTNLVMDTLLGYVALMYVVDDFLALFHEFFIALFVVALRHILILLRFFLILILLSLTILHYIFYKLI